MQVRNEKARRFLMNMRKKPRVNFEKYFVKADRGALRLLQRMLAFDPVERPTCEEALADPYFNGLSQPGREPSAQPVSKLSFEFERRKLTTDEVRIMAKSSCVLHACLWIPWPAVHCEASLAALIAGVECLICHLPGLHVIIFYTAKGLLCCVCWHHSRWHDMQSGSVHFRMLRKAVHCA